MFDKNRKHVIDTTWTFACIGKQWAFNELTVTLRHTTFVYFINKTIPLISYFWDEI